MINSKLKSRSSSGFTLVELLIVIVVIAILAAITIVAYGNISARAKTTQGSTAAANVVKVAEAINADNSAYPINTAAFAAGSTSTKLPSGITLQDPTGTAPTTGNLNSLAAFAAAPSSGNTVAVALVCSASGVAAGGAVYWYDFSTPSTIHVTYFGSVGATTTVSSAYPTLVKWVTAGC